MDKEDKITADIIIDRPTLVSKTRYFTEFSLQIMGWILWALCIYPLIMTIVWYLAFLLFNREIFKPEGMQNPKYFSIGAVILATIYAVMFVWSRYNAYRFRGKDKRRSSGTATPDKMAAYYKVQPENIIDLQNSRNVAVYFLNDDIIEINSDKASKFRALYAPQNQGKHHDKNIIV